MYRSSHTSINDAVIVLSPDPIRKTVGNFLKSTQTTEYLSNLKKETNLPRCSPWFANYVKVFPIVEKFSKLSTNPQISPYNPYYRNENTLPKTGDGVVQHGQVTQSYDDNGNLTSDGSYTYSWDYRNRLTDSTANDNISHYLYDHDNRRVQMEVDEGEGTTTTKYWNKYYSTKGNALTRYIFAGDTLLATIEGEGTATSTYCNHPDHLGGANVTTDESGNLSELDTYYPFGAIRQSEKEGSFDQKRKAIGQYYDEATALNYLNARYMSGTQGRFLSQDPSFLEVGSPNLQNKVPMQNLIGSSYASGIGSLGLSNKYPSLYLADPQLANSYSYARNNPIVYKDEKGNSPLLLVGVGIAVGMAGQYFNDYQEISAGNYNKQLNIGDYLASGTKGVGVTFAAEAGIGWAGLANFSLSLAQNKILGKPIDFMSATVDSIGTMVTGGIMKQLPGSISSLPKISSSQFDTEATKTLIRNTVSEVSFSNAISAISAQVKVIQQQITSMKSDKEK